MSASLTVDQFWAGFMLPATPWMRRLEYLPEGSEKAVKRRWKVEEGQ